MKTRRVLISLALSLFFTTEMLIAAPLDAQEFYQQLVHAAIERTRHRVRYDGSYSLLKYPMGDVPSSIGVCTDVVIRSFRHVGIDLQQAVHVDMSKVFSSYPRIWGLTRPDYHIDHRRVPNLQTFFKRHATVLAISQDGSAYQPGDLVTWMLPGHLPHIGIVVTQKSADGKRPLVVHNIGSGPKMEDMLNAYPITGHYRFGANYQGRGRFTPSGIF